MQVTVKGEWDDGAAESGLWWWLNGAKCRTNCTDLYIHTHMHWWALNKLCTVPIPYYITEMLYVCGAGGEHGAPLYISLQCPVNPWWFQKSQCWLRGEDTSQWIHSQSAQWLPQRTTTHICFRVLTKTQCGSPLLSFRCLPRHVRFTQTKKTVEKLETLPLVWQWALPDVSCGLEPCSLWQRMHCHIEICASGFPKRKGRKDYSCFKCLPIQRITGKPRPGFGWSSGPFWHFFKAEMGKAAHSPSTCHSAIIPVTFRDTSYSGPGCCFSDRKWPFEINLTEAS